MLFDVDGTLLDTNWFHTVTWWRVFRRHGIEISMSRIHPLVGMGADQLVEELLGEERPEIREGHGTEFERFIPEIKTLPGAADLLREVKARHAQVVLCTSAQKAHVEAMCKAIGADDAVDEVIDGDDVERSKPAPDVFEAALDRLQLDRSHAIVVGDTRWDVEAASRAGLTVVCVLTGGNRRETLDAAGAAAVYEDVADVLATLDDDGSPLGRLLRATGSGQSGSEPEPFDS